jgi:hypothetical protein
VAEKQGFVALYRKIQENFLWQEKRVFSRAEAWIDMLLNVRWAEDEEKVLIGNRIIMCGYGQSLKSLDTWAKRWRWSRSAVSRFFTLLQNENMIVTKSETQTTRLTICNFRQYQELRNANETHLKRIWNASETHLNTEQPREPSNQGNHKILSASKTDAAHLQEEFYLTKKKRKLKGKRLETFNEFWEAFAYKKDRANAADAWMDIPELTKALVDTIITAAKAEAKARPEIIAEGRTPKMAQGWITARRWEDETIDGKPKSKWAKYMEENRCIKESLPD